MAMPVQERLRLRRAALDTWSIREKLALACAVQRSGDQNWSCVSRTIKSFAEPNRPADWFSSKNCAQQYASLLENTETPKRKKRSAGSTDKSEVETPGEYIIRKLVAERSEELQKQIAGYRDEYNKILNLANAICLGEVDDKVPFLIKELEEEEVRKEQEKEDHKKWLKEREERKIELERAWKPGLHLASLRRTSSLSEPSSEADSPLSEPLNVDVPEEGGGGGGPKATPTPTSPLLTSLLKSPANVNANSSSILHSVITSPRVVSPSFTLLNSSPVNLPGPLGAPPGAVSSNLKNLVSNALGSFSEGQKPTPLSPSQGAPTLSMLLELPPSCPGTPLPMLQPQPPAPPPYSEHLGPPPPYFLAAEYLQKQRAEQAAQAQLAATSPIKIIEDNSLSLPVSSPIGPEAVRRLSFKSSILDQVELEEDPSLRDKRPLLNTSDHDYVDSLLLKNDEALEEEIVEQVEVGPLLDDLRDDEEAQISEGEMPSLPEKEEKQEKKSELDVFEFDEQVEGGDVEDAKLNYLKSNAQRLAKKEAEAHNNKTMKLLSPRRSTEDLVEEVKIEMEPTPSPNVEAASESAESSRTKEHKEDVSEEKAVEDITVADVVKEIEAEKNIIEQEVLPAAVEESSDTIPDKKEEAAQINEEVSKVKDEEVPLAEEVAPLTSPCNTPIPQDEKLSENVTKSTKKRRRGTITLNPSDSIPNSPAAPLTEEEKAPKARKMEMVTFYTFMQGHRLSGLFFKPNFETFPDYFEGVKRPMSIHQIKKRTDSGVLKTLDEVKRDGLLMCMNAVMYNVEHVSTVSGARALAKDILDQYDELIKMSADEHFNRRGTREKRGTRSEGKRLPSGGGAGSAHDQPRKKIKLEEN